MKKYLIATLSTMFLFACTVTNHHSGTSEVKKTNYENINTREDSLGIKITSALNILKPSNKENIDSINFNGLWIVIENQKDIAQSLDLDIHVQDEDNNIHIKDERLTVYIPSGSKTLFLPEINETGNTDYDHSSFVIDGNTPVDSAINYAVQLDIKIKNLIILEQNITVK